MSFTKMIISQFGRPSGVLGKLAGAIMAHRPSNIERNIWTLDLLDIQPTDRVLEIGFGPGVAVAAAAERAVSGLVAGIDHSATMLKQARKRNAQAIAAGRVDLRQGSAMALPDFGVSFDRIYAVNSIGFWPEPVEILKQLRSLLQPGGIIAITEQPRLKGASDESARRAGRRFEAYLEEAGFEQIQIEFRQMKPVAAVCTLAEK